MSTLQFSWLGHGPLAAQLAAPITSASIGTSAHGRPDSLTLWHLDGTGLQIRSKMHDVAERTEVGVLEFKPVTIVRGDERKVDLPESFSGPVKVSKLVVIESGTRAESGMVLTASDGQQITIVAGAYPYTLAIEGILSMPHVFEPEYPLTDYSRAHIA